jgi:hypothetical protein
MAAAVRLSAAPARPASSAVSCGRVVGRCPWGCWHWQWPFVNRCAAGSLTCGVGTGESPTTRFDRSILRCRAALHGYHSPLQHDLPRPPWPPLDFPALPPPPVPPAADGRSCQPKDPTCTPAATCAAGKVCGFETSCGKPPVGVAGRRGALLSGRRAAGSVACQADISWCVSAAHTLPPPENHPTLLNPTLLGMTLNS